MTNGERLLGQVRNNFCTASPARWFYTSPMSNTEDRLRWGILGTGFISHTIIDAIATSDGSVVTTIAGRNPDRLADFRRQHHISASTTDFDEVLGDPDVDVVYIGLPNHAHHELAIAASFAGKAVLSEKSLTTTMATAHQLIDAVRRNETFFVEGLMYLAHPLYRTLNLLLADGRLGELRSIRGSYAANIAHLVNPHGGGSIYNLGCYPVSLLHYVVQTMCGEAAFSARRMSGVGNRSMQDGNVVDAAMSVRFDNGVLASVHSTDSYGMEHEFAITGTNGTLRFVTNPWLPVAGANLIEWTPFSGQPETIVVEDSHDAFHHQIKMVERSLTDGLIEVVRPSPRWQDSLEIMSMLTEWERLCLTS